MINAPPTVIVPIYRGLETTRACLAALLVSRETEVFDVVLVDDASPEEDIRALCTEYQALLNAHLITHEDNRGFVVSVNEAMSEATGDVVLLNSDTVVPSGWLGRLRTAADKHPKAATVTPFSNNATICSYPHFVLSSPLPRGLSLEVLDGIVKEVNRSKVAEIPTAVGFCMYIRRAALQEVGLFDEDAFGRGYGEENEWCCRASVAGWQHLLAADVFVYHEGGVSFGEEASFLQSAAIEVLNERYPNYSELVQRFIEDDPLLGLRRNIDRARAKISGQAGVLLAEAEERFDSLRRHAKLKSAQLNLSLSEMALEQKRLVEQLTSAEQNYQLQITQVQQALHNTRESKQQLQKDYEARCSRYEHLLKEARDAFTRSDAQVRELDLHLTETRAAYANACEQVRALEVARDHLEAQWGLRLQRKLESLRGIS